MAADKDDSAMSQPWPCYPVKPPPRGEDLPYDDGVPLESQMHVEQMTLLKESLELGWADRNDFYVACNMFVYYSELQSKKNDFRGPDVFVVLHTSRKRRRSWVVWEEEGRAPDVVIELTSPSTEAFDRGPKKDIYARVLRVAEYFLFDPIEKRLEGYRLDVARSEYEPIQPDERGRYRSQALGLWLGVERGRYHREEDLWLRWIDDDGRALPCGTDLADAAQANADQAQAEAQQAQAEAQQAQAEAQQAQAEAQQAQAEAQQAQAEAQQAQAEAQQAQAEAQQAQAEAQQAQAEAQQAQAEAQQAQAEAQQAQAEAQQAQAEAQQARRRLVAAGRALVAAGKEPEEVASMLGVEIGELSADGG